MYRSKPDTLQVNVLVNDCVVVRVMTVWFMRVESAKSVRLTVSSYVPQFETVMLMFMQQPCPTTVLKHVMFVTTT